MTSFAEQITGLAIPDFGAAEAQHPRIWWYHGNKQVKTAGSFYTKQAEFIEGLETPWAIDNRFDDEVGYSTPTLKVMFLTKRSQPFRDEKDPATGRRLKDVPRKWFLRWETGMQIYTELLMLIEGYEHPVVWCVDGLIGKAVDGKGGILKTYEGGLLAQAGRVAKKNLPPWSFWVPISTKRTADGKVAYEDTGYGSFVTPPAIQLPDNPMDTLFVGPELMERGGDILRSLPDWAKFKRMPEGAIEASYVIEEVKQLPSGRNVPQPIGDDGDTY